MIYMLDTDISSYIIRTRPVIILDRYIEILSETEEYLCISAITCSELIYGYLLKPSVKKIVEDFLNNIEIIKWDANAANHYADIRVDLKNRGIVIGAHDMQIAAHARSLGAKLITNNEKHFKNIPGIITDNWMQ